MSIVTMMRKGLRVKGSSEHSGRGSYWMNRSEEITYDELYERIQVCLERWEREGIVRGVEEVTRKEGRVTERSIKIEFDEAFGSYRTFRTSNTIVDGGGMLGVVTYTFTKVQVNG